MLASTEIYFLQNLVLFANGGVVTPDQIKKDWDTILRHERKGSNQVIGELQEESDRLHHGIQIKPLLKKAGVRIPPTFAEVFG